MTKNQKKYIASIVRKYCLGNECYLLSLDHVSIGELDEKTQIFTDKEGNSFAPMSNPWMITSEIPYLYDSIITLDQMKEVAKNSQASLKIAMKEYEDMCKKTVYLVGKTEDGKTFSTTLNTDQLKASASPQTEEVNPQEENTSNEITIDNLGQLLQEIDSGKYSETEIQSIVEELKITKEDLEDVIGYIELQKGNERDSIEEMKEIEVDEVFQEIRKTLVAQDEPIQRIITELARKRLDNRCKSQGLLITGSAGVGKTSLMKLIEEYTDIPVHRIEATQLSLPGFAGNTIEEELWKLYKACGEDIVKTENAILFFDKIDNWLNGNENVNPDIMQIPLQVMEGEVYDACQDINNPQRIVEINTQNMTVVLGGTYTQKNNLGFLEHDKTRKITMKDFIDKGQIPQEWMGRMTVIRLNDLDIDSLRKVLLESNESATHIQEDIFQKIGVKITFTNDYITSIATQAAHEETGAKSLKERVEEATWEAFYEVQKNKDQYQEVIIDTSEKGYQLVKKRNK